MISQNELGLTLRAEPLTLSVLADGGGGGRLGVQAQLPLGQNQCF